MATPVDNEKLREEIRMLGALLGEVVSEQRGPASLELIESVRHHARDRRRAGGDATRQAAENALTESIRALDETDIATVIRAFSIFFDLANLAEDRHRVRILRERERSRPGEWRAESLGAAVHELRRRSVPSSEIADLLSKLHIEPVFTAHPTEAKRRSVREKVRRLRHVLTDWDQRGDLLPAEVARIQLRLKCEIKALWQTDFHRPTRPRVREEVQRGLSFADTLWEVAPQLRSDLRTAVAREYPDLHSSDRPTLTFGSWIGGDRDGHDGVTADVTADTLLQLRLAALSHHRTKADELERILSMSIQQTGVYQPLVDAVQQALGRWRVLRNRQKYISEFELFRRWLNVVDWRLEQTAAVRFGARSEEIDAEPPEGAYASTEELLADAQLMVDALEATGADDVAAVSVRTWLDQISAFGLHFAKLDVRQESGRHERTIAEAMRQLGVEADYSGLSEADRVACLAKSMGTISAPVEEMAVEEPHAETLRSVLVLARAVQTLGPDAIGGYVISMTHSASDVLEVLWLWEWAKRHAASQGGRPVEVHLPIIPLFETIDDLRRAPAMLNEMLGVEAYRRYLGDRPQIIMVGYSDSTKDGGYLAATWELHCAQRSLAEAAKAAGVRMVIFHGRGGALGRGGGPAARGILSLPAASVAGSLRMTEQGEVLSERYDDPRVAYRHLEQVTWATLLVSGLPALEPDPAWLDAIRTLTDVAYRNYRELVEKPGFLHFFRTATPIEAIERLEIGSRPARRGGKPALSNLRAIPWVFSWTQNRVILPAWYSMGAALHQFAAAHGWTLLRDMYQRWPYFQATIDNAELALAKADMPIAAKYAELAGSDADAKEVWDLLRTEYDRSRSAVLAVTDAKTLLDRTPWLEKSLQARNPYIDPLNLIQVDLYRRLAEVEGKDEEKEKQLRELLRQSIMGIAAGMRTTG